MQNLLTTQAAQREQSRKEILEALQNDQMAVAGGLLAGRGARGMLGIKSPQEKLAMQTDAAMAAVTAPQGTPEYFKQLAQQFEQRGLRDSAMAAAEKAMEVEKTQLGLKGARRTEADTVAMRDLARQVPGNIQQDPGNWYRNFANLLVQAGMPDQADKALAAARNYKVKNENLADYIGIDNASLRKLYSPESIRDANLARLNGASRTKVAEILQDGAVTTAGGIGTGEGQINTKDLIDAIDGPMLESMNAASRTAVTSGIGKMLAEGNPADLLTALQSAVYEDEEAKKAAMSFLKEAEETSSAAKKEVATLEQMRVRVPQMITGTFAPTRVGIKTAFASIGLAGAETLDELASTNVFLSQLGNLVLDRIKTLGTNPSNADRDFLIAMLPNIQQNPESIVEIIDYMLKRAKETQNKAEDVNKWYQTQSEKGFQSFELPSQYIAMRNLEETGVTVDPKDIKVDPTVGLRTSNPEFFVDGNLVDNAALGQLLKQNQYSPETKQVIKEVIQNRSAAQ